MNKMFKKFMFKSLQYIVLCASLLLICFLAPTIQVDASSYNYDFWRNPIPSSEGLSYKDTYYNKDIIAADGSGEILTFSSYLQDMKVYNGSIYIVDGRTLVSDIVEIPTTTESMSNDAKTIKNRSYIYILNGEMKWEKVYTEFKINEEAREHVMTKLSNYYNFKTPIEEITYAQINADSINTRAPYVMIKDENDEWVPGMFLNDAQGITVTELGIYIADTGNSRIIKLNFDFEVVEVFLTPDDATYLQTTDGEQATSKVRFRPLKVAVDVNGRVYTVTKDTYAGIVEYNTKGEFNRFLGKNLVTANPLKAFWAKIMSEVQIASIALDLPPEFINITIDNEGFLYTTSYPDADAVQAKEIIKAINTSGKDVLKRNGYVTPDGDTTYLISHKNKNAIIGSSLFSAIDVSDRSIFTAVDKVRGRLFTYDNEGNLLYITGEKGQLSDSISDPAAVAYYTTRDENNAVVEELIFVVDRGSKSIIAFQTTEFGLLVNEATDRYLKNDITGAEEVWREVIKMNSNYELGYVGIGKSLLRKGSDYYEEAMQNFKLGHNAKYYSQAYQLYRDEMLRNSFDVIMTGVVITALGIGFLVFLKYWNKRRLRLKLYGKEEEND